MKLKQSDFGWHTSLVPLSSLFSFQNTKCIFYAPLYSRLQPTSPAVNISNLFPVSRHTCWNCLYACSCVCERVYLTNNDQQYSYEGQKGDVQRAAKSHTGDDEGDNEDEEADDHQRSHCLGPS